MLIHTNINYKEYLSTMMEIFYNAVRIQYVIYQIAQFSTTESKLR